MHFSLVLTKKNPSITSTLSNLLQQDWWLEPVEEQFHHLVIGYWVNLRIYFIYVGADFQLFVWFGSSTYVRFVKAIFFLSKPQLIEPEAMSGPHTFVITWRDQAFWAFTSIVSVLSKIIWRLFFFLFKQAFSFFYSNKLLVSEVFFFFKLICLFL